MNSQGGGYTFTGWNAAVPATMPANNINLIAQWNINSYTISFNSVGGSAVASITTNYGTAVTAPAAPTRTGYTFTGWNPAVPTTMPADNVALTAQWNINSNTAPAVDAGANQTVTMSQGSSPSTGWSYSAWTGDADSGVESSYTYTAAHNFGRNPDGSVTLNGVDFTESNNTSGYDWSIGGDVNYYRDGVGNITGSSKDLLKGCAYFFNSPITVTFEGLTVGQSYKAIFFSLAWGNNVEEHTFVMTGGDSLEVDRNVYNVDNGIKISCNYTATGTTQEFTIIPNGNVFPIYAMVNRAEIVSPATATLDGTVTDADGDVTTMTWTKVSGPGSVQFADISALDTTATFEAVGTYVLRLTANDGEVSSSADLTVIVVAED